MSTIWVLGGNGFIGQEVVSLLKAKHKIITTSQSSLKHNQEGIRHYHIKYDFNNFRELLSQHKIDTVIYLSGNSYPANSEHSPFYEIESTYLPFLSLAEAVRLNSKFTKLWFASSVAVYGKNYENPLNEKSATYPLSFYAISKLNIEEYVKYYSRVHNMNTGVFRIFSTYGPKLKRQLVYDVVQKILASPEKITIFGDGTEARDLSFISDQARAICLLIEKVKPEGDIYNVGSGKLYTVKEIVDRIASILKLSPQVEYTPKRSFDGSTWTADISKLKEIGYEPQFDIQKGLERTIEGILSEN